MKGTNTFVLKAILVVTTLFMWSCTKEKPVVPTPAEPVKTGQVLLKLDHVWGHDNGPFYMNQPLRHPDHGDSIQFSLLRYYLSGFELLRTDGLLQKLPAHVQLMNVAGALVLAGLDAVPVGTYKGLSFVLGLDSATHAAGPGPGVLGTAYGMYRGLGQGFNCLLVEGLSPQSPNDSIQLALGGCQMPMHAERRRTIDFGADQLLVKEGEEVSIDLFVDVSHLWEDQSVSTVFRVWEAGAAAQDLVSNFAAGFRFGHIH